MIRINVLGPPQTLTAKLLAALFRLLYGAPDICRRHNVRRITRTYPLGANYEHMEIPACLICEKADATRKRFEGMLDDAGILWRRKARYAWFGPHD